MPRSPVRKTKTNNAEKASEISSNVEVKKKFKIPLVAIIVAAVILLAGLGFLFKDKFIVAIVDKKPIFRFQLIQRLTSTYGKDTLENMIVEKLVDEQAKKDGVKITDKDISNEIDNISKTLGQGMKIEDALSLQGITMADFKNQIRIRLEVNQILGKDITVSDQEINDYIKANSSTMTATAGAVQKDEASGKIKEQKISDKIQTWVQDLLAKAKITRFLKQ